MSAVREPGHRGGVILEMRMRLAVVFAICLLASPLAADWNQWRGQGRDGAADTFKPPPAWPATLTQVWKREVGIGHSSPIVAAGRVFQHARAGDQEVVRALDPADGKVIWEQSYPAPYTMNSAATQHGKGPKSTPLWSGGRLFTLGISGILSAFDAATGKVLWRHDFTKEFPQTSPIYGVAMSPIAIDADVIAHVGGPGRGALAAFDAATGKMKWAWRGDGPGYASPVVMTGVGGVRQIITQTERHVVGVNAADGVLLWQMPFTTAYDQNAVTPVVRGDVVINSGLDRGIAALRVSKSADAWKAEQIWHAAEPSNYMSTPVLHAGVLYGLGRRNSGHLFAMDAATGKVLWTTGGRHGDNAALARAGDTILALTTDAQLIVFPASRDAFREIRKYTVASSPTWAHPALAAQGLLIKDESSLALWRP
jgi:outer membrane protein assembly factor BamB